MTDLGPYLLGYNDTPECGIYTGDARELAKAIPDESVDLIFTDPVYQNIDDYRWLAETAARVLKPNSAAIRAGSGAGGVVAMTLVARTIRAAARGLVNTSPPSWLRKLAFPVRPAELGPVKRKGKKVTG